MHSNFMISDMLLSAQAFALMPLFLFIPGYVLGWLLDVLGFRRRSLAEQVLLSTPLSLAVCPIATYLVGWAFSMGALWFVYGCFWALFPVLIAVQARRSRWPELRVNSRYTWIALGIVAVWCVVALASLVDLQIQDHLYSSVTFRDYSFRVPITQALAQKGLPGVNPFFYPGQNVPLRYHHFWMLLCSLPVRLFGVRAVHAMWGATPWCGIALMSMIPLFLKFFQEQTAHLRRKTVIGMCLLAVTGLDIIPTAVQYLSAPLFVQGDMEWWNEQVTSWVDSVLWCPHHVSALVVCLLGFLLLWNVRSSSRRDRVVAVAISAAAFSSACGLSVFVTFTFALFMAVWLLIEMHEGHWLTAGLLSASGMLAVLLSVPYMKTLLGPAGGGGGFAAFGIRPFYVAYTVLGCFGVRSPAAYQAASLCALPLNYFLELGFFGVVALFRFIDIRRGARLMADCEKASWMMVAVSLFVATFLQSAVQGNPNDLAWRSFLPFQFITLLWAIPLVEGWIRRPNRGPVSGPVAGPLAIRHSWLVIFVVLGALGTLYQVVCLRTYSVGVEQGKILAPAWLDDDPNSGRRHYAIRELYTTLDSKLPKNVTVQHNPMARNSIEQLLYDDHQQVAAVGGCGANFGGDLRACKDVILKVYQLYRVPNSIKELDSACRNLSVDIVVATDTDYVWADRRSWVWRSTPIAANQFARAFDCGNQSKLASKYNH